MWCDFNFLKFVKTCFVTYQLVYLRECPMSIWEDCVFSCCWLECSVYSFSSNCSIMLFKTSVFLLIFVQLLLNFLLKRIPRSCLQYIDLISLDVVGHALLQRRLEKVVQSWLSMCTPKSDSSVIMVKLDSGYWRTYSRPPNIRSESTIFKVLNLYPRTF